MFKLNVVKNTIFSFSCTSLNSYKIFTLGASDGNSLLQWLLVSYYWLGLLRSMTTVCIILL